MKKRGRPPGIARPYRLHVLLSESEQERLDVISRVRGLTPSDVVRQWIREASVPAPAEWRWIDRKCGSCARVVHVRADIEGPWYCAEHERRRSRVVPIAKARRKAAS